MPIYADFQRYQPQLLLNNWGYDAQLKLKHSHLVCVGAGGLGSVLLYYLAAAGLGAITIIDHDHVTLTNLHRQILYKTADIGLPKAKIAAQQLQMLNPDIDINYQITQLTAKNAEELISPCDVVADCTDNYASKLLINDTCYRLHKVWVTASALQWQGHIALFNGQSNCYRCIFEDIESIAPSCNEAGILGPLLGILGSIQAMTILRSLAGLEQNSQLITYDAIDHQLKKFQLSSNPNCPLQHEHFLQPKQKAEYVYNTKTKDSLTAEDLLIDVRSHLEHQQDDQGGICLPLEKLTNTIKALSHDRDLVLYCTTGKRSRLAYRLLEELGYTNIFLLNWRDCTF